MNMKCNTFVKKLLVTLGWMFGLDKRSSLQKSVIRYHDRI